MKLPQIPKQWLTKLEKMTARQLILLAFCVSVFLSVAVYMQLSGMEEKQPKAVQNMVTVVSATADIPAKTQIRAEMLKMIAMPADVVPPGALTDMNMVVGKFTKVDILANDVVTDKKFFEDARLSGFRGSIPDDLRAISLPITDITGISGFAKPGDKVDVILVSDKLYKNAVSSEMLLQNVLLLALNKNAENTGAAVTGKKEDGKEQMLTATLAVSAEEAVRLAGVQAQGTIYLILRPFEPKDGFLLIPPKLVPLAGNSGSENNSQGAAPPQAPPSSQVPAYTPPPPSYAPQNEAPPPQAAPVSVDRGVEVIRGTAVSRDKIK